MDSTHAPTSSLVARDCRVQGRRICLEINDRQTLSFPASKYPTLEAAPQSELEKVQLAEDGRSVRWESLDEVVFVEDVAQRRYVHSPVAVAGS
jgi:hypothetical protein